MPRRDHQPQPVKVRWWWVKHDACDRKVAHTTIEQAFAARGDDRTLYVYRCPFSDVTAHWHLAHPPSMKTMRKVASAIRARAYEGAT